jgi:hypothetical protein
LDFELNLGDKLNSETMLIDVIALLLLAGVTYLGIFFMSKGVDDPTEEVAHEEKIFDTKKGINKFNL